MNNSNSLQSQFADPSQIVIRKNFKNNPPLSQQVGLEDNFGRHFEYLHLCLFAEQGIDIRTYLQAEDIEGTRQALLTSMTTKTETHFLHNRETGITKHLAMLGG